MNAKDDCERIMNELSPIAMGLLEKNGEFYPFGAVISNIDELKQIAFHDGKENPKSIDVIINLKKIYKELAQKKEILSAGIVVNSKVQLPNGKKQDAFIIDLQHSEGYSVKVVFPYVKKIFGGYVWNDIFAMEGHNDIFFD